MRPPLSLLESMALGKCVVTSSLGGNSEVIEDSYDGAIVDFDNLGQVAARVFSLITNDGERERIGIQARETIKEMYSSQEYEKIIDYYNRILTAKDK